MYTYCMLYNDKIIDFLKCKLFQKKNYPLKVQSIIIKYYRYVVVVWLHGKLFLRTIDML